MSVVELVVYVVHGHSHHAKGVKAVKKLALSIVVLACVLVFSPKPAHAASELETWCLPVVKAYP